MNDDISARVSGPELLMWTVKTAARQRVTANCGAIPLPAQPKNPRADHGAEFSLEKLGFQLLPTPACSRP